MAAAVSNKHIEGDNLSADKAALEVGVDRPGGLRSSGAAWYIPGARLSSG